MKQFLLSLCCVCVCASAAYAAGGYPKRVACSKAADGEYVRVELLEAGQGIYEVKYTRVYGGDSDSAYWATGLRCSFLAVDPRVAGCYRTGRNAGENYDQRFIVTKVFRSSMDSAGRVTVEERLMMEVVSPEIETSGRVDFDFALSECTAEL